MTGFLSLLAAKASLLPRKKAQFRTEIETRKGVRSRSRGVTASCHLSCAVQFCGPNWKQEKNNFNGQDSLNRCMKSRWCNKSLFDQLLKKPFMNLASTRFDLVDWFNLLDYQGFR